MRIVTEKELSGFGSITLPLNSSKQNRQFTNSEGVWYFCGKVGSRYLLSKNKTNSTTYLLNGTVYDLETGLAK